MGSELTVTPGTSRRNQHVYYSVKGFVSYQDLEEFCRLIEYAQYGRVIVDWRATREDEQWPDGEDDDYPPEDVPVYDDTDRSQEPRYVLAEALVAAAMLDFFVNDVEERTPFLSVSTPFSQDELLFQVIGRTDLRLERR